MQRQLMDERTTSYSPLDLSTYIPTDQPTFLFFCIQAMERQLIDEETTFWDDNFPGLIRERRAGAFTHVLSVIFVRGAYLYGLAEAVTHGRSIIQNNSEDTPICRAFYKIKEVTSRAGIAYSSQWTAVSFFWSGRECLFLFLCEIYCHKLESRSEGL